MSCGALCACPGSVCLLHEQSLSAATDSPCTDEIYLYFRVNYAHPRDYVWQNDIGKWTIQAQRAIDTHIIFITYYVLCRIISPWHGSMYIMDKVFTTHACGVFKACTRCIHTAYPTNWTWIQILGRLVFDVDRIRQFMEDKFFSRWRALGDSILWDNNVSPWKCFIIGFSSYLCLQPGLHLTRDPFKTTCDFFQKYLHFL